MACHEQAAKTSLSCSLLRIRPQEATCAILLLVYPGVCSEIIPSVCFEACRRPIFQSEPTSVFATPDTISCVTDGSLPCCTCQGSIAYSSEPPPSDYCDDVNSRSGAHSRPNSLQDRTRNDSSAPHPVHVSEVRSRAE